MNLEPQPSITTSRVADPADAYQYLLERVKPLLDPPVREARRASAAPRVQPSDPPPPRDGGSVARPAVVPVLATFEALAVTMFSRAVQLAPGTPSAAYVDSLAAAATTAFLHLEALGRLGAEPSTARFWIPDHMLDGSVGFLDALVAQKELSISGYFFALTTAARDQDARAARTFASALGVESEHRALARLASIHLRGAADPEAPNNRAFEDYPHRTARAVLNASRRLGFGYGQEGSRPGEFYDFPGDPRRLGVGGHVLTQRPM